MDFRLQKNMVRRVNPRRSQNEQDCEDTAYWLSQPPEDRISATAFVTRRLYRMRTGRDLPAMNRRIVLKVRSRK